MLSLLVTAIPMVVVVVVWFSFASFMNGSFRTKFTLMSGIQFLTWYLSLLKTYVYRRDPGSRKRLLYSILWSAVICVLTYHILHFLAEQFDGCKKKSNCYCNYSLQDQTISRCYSIDTDGCPRTKAVSFPSSSSSLLSILHSPS